MSMRYNYSLYRRNYNMREASDRYHRSINHALFESLRKQRELSNRLSVIQQHQQQKLKILQNRQRQAHEHHQSSLDRSLRKQQIDQSFQKEKRTEIYNSHLFKQLRNQLCASIHHKKQGILQSRKQLYRDMKKAEQNNLNKIHVVKQAQMLTKRELQKKAKMMQVNCKENIKRYWNDRAEVIQQSKQEDVLHKTFLLENSQNCIRSLQTKEQKIREQISRTENSRADKVQDLPNQSLLNFPEIILNPNS